MFCSRSRVRVSRFERVSAVKAFIRQAIRRWRNWLARKRWQAERRRRQPAPAVAAIDPLILQARNSHGRVRPMHEKRRELAHEQLRKGIAR
jgi:hypothetical protein